MALPILSASDLQHINQQHNLRINYIGRQNDYITKQAFQGNYIININPNSNMGHWTALYVKGKKAVYFDPFGVVPPPQVLIFIKNNGLKLDWSTNDIQNIKTSSCGWFCLAFIHYMITHQRPNVKNFTALFQNDTMNNEKILKTYLRHYQFI